MKEQEWEVEAILDWRVVGGETEYLIKWKDYPPEESTWEHESCLKKSQKLLKEFKKAQKEKEEEAKRKRAAERWLDMTGLFIIGFGTGGIKPCVSAFGGDQFELGQERMLSLYFSMFYFSIIAGSMISTFISPIFRSIPCLGQDSCYPLAFGVPAILMVVATCIFMAGSFWYKKPPPKENIFGEVARLMGKSVSNKMKSKESKEHWLDHYMTNHECESDSRCMELRAEKGKKKACHKAGLIEDTKSLLRLIVMILPAPMFWALYDQQGSVWLIQGIQMNCKVGSIMILPDQMQTLNAVLILLFIPLFQVIIYPVASMCIELTPLRKMFAGGLLASLAFVMAGFVQLSVNTTLPSLPGGGEAYVSVWNQLYLSPNCVITATVDGKSLQVPYGKPLSDDKTDKNHPTQTFHVKRGSVTVNINYGNCNKNGADLKTQYTFTADQPKIYYVAINYNGIFNAIAKPDKPTDGTGEFALGITTSMDADYKGNFCVCRGGADCNPRRPSDFYYWETNYNFEKNDDRDGYSPFTGGNQAGGNATVYTFKPVKPGVWKLYYMHDTPKTYGQKTPSTANVTDTGCSFEIEDQGGVYVMNLAGNNKNPTCARWQLVQSNKVSILWQVPQIATITAAEILFSITGYEFAYSQSAPSMKALVQALWLLTTAFGDSIIVIITLLDVFSNLAVQFFGYAAIMVVVNGIFLLLSIFYYEYNYYTTDDKDDAEDSESECSSNHTRTPPRSFALTDVEMDVIDMRL